VDEVVESENGVRVVGYTDMPSRLPGTSSTLYATNVAKFLLSLGPATNPDMKVGRYLCGCAHMRCIWTDI